MNRQIQNIVNRILSEKKSEGETCEGCGTRGMVEGMCSECGYNEAEFKESKKLSKGQKYIANQAPPKDKIGANDFAKLRSKKSEVKEKLYGRQHILDKNKNNKIDPEDLKMVRNESLYSIELYGKKHIFNENEMINIIENIILEEKKKKTITKLPNVTKDSLAKSKKENDDYISSVVKKMKDYLKDGSKGKYDMEPKHFPKGNGELSKMDKMAYTPSDTAQEYIDNFTGAGLENLDYDEIHPNEDWVTMNLVGSSKTGNNPKWANAVETGVGERRNKIRKNNLLAKVKRDAYQKDSQPVKIDKSGSDLGDTVDQLLNKYTKKSSNKKTNESIETKDKDIVSEEINIMKNLIGYNKITQ